MGTKFDTLINKKFYKDELWLELVHVLVRAINLMNEIIKGSLKSNQYESSTKHENFKITQFRKKYTSSQQVSFEIVFRLKMWWKSSNSEHKQ